MTIVVGLGNPGTEYALTRHNAGVMMVDHLAESIPSDYGWRRHKEAYVYEANQYFLAKTAGKFMNESGVWVRELIKNLKFEISNFYLVHDDLDLKLGDYKIQKGIGPKVHNGVQSVEQCLGEKDFWRVRIGVDNRDPVNRIPGEQYVLQKFLPNEREILDTVINNVTNEILKDANR
jgi:peptidyl-tRNA hydrolase, PTH1 family